MPNSDPEICYWDSDVLLSYIDGVTGRVENIRSFMADADNGLITIATSMLTIVEVAFGAAEKVGGALDPGKEADIRSLWLPPSPIKLIDLHLGIAERARELIREAITRGVKMLKPADATHLASAESVGATRLHTYNLDDFDRWAPIIGATVEHPIHPAPTLL
jgi:predicted nucleic acid-binding protein